MPHDKTEDPARHPQFLKRGEKHAAAGASRSDPALLIEQEKPTLPPDEKFVVKLASQCTMVAGAGEQVGGGVSEADIVKRDVAIKAKKASPARVKELKRAAHMDTGSGAAGEGAEAQRGQPAQEDEEMEGAAGSTAGGASSTGGRMRAGGARGRSSGGLKQRAKGRRAARAFAEDVEPAENLAGKPLQGFAKRAKHDAAMKAAAKREQAVAVEGHGGRSGVPQ